MRIWIFFGEDLMFIVFCIVLSPCAVRLRMLFRVVRKKCYFVYGAGIGSGFIFQETKTLCSPIRTRLYRYRYPLNGSSMLRTETLLFK
jgi:hypothetical protein